MTTTNPKTSSRLGQSDLLHKLRHIQPSGR
jgi:hypothetical protein